MTKKWEPCVWLAFVLVLAGRTTLAGEVTFETGDGRLAVRAGGKPVATYVWRDTQILRPYLAHVHAPDGTQVTRHHPPRERQDESDHAAMHPGIWLAFGDLSGADFWRNKGQVEHVEFVEPPAAFAAGGRFTVRNRYRADGQTLCEEKCRIEIRPQPGGTLLVWDSRFTGERDFYFGDQEEMGLGVRVATPLAVKHGGTIVNSLGGVNEKQVWGRPADWCDYRGRVEGREAGLMLLPDSRNVRPSWFHARDYGVLVANPFGQRAFTKGPASRVSVTAGQELRLRFGVLVHAGPAEPEAAFKQWRQLEASATE